MKLSKHRTMLLLSIIPHIILLLSVLLMNGYSIGLSTMHIVLQITSYISLIVIAFVLGVVPENNKSSLIFGGLTIISYSVFYYVIELSPRGPSYIDLELLLIVIVISVITFATGSFIRNIVG